MIYEDRIETKQIFYSLL